MYISELRCPCYYEREILVSATSRSFQRWRSKIAAKFVRAWMKYRALAVISVLGGNLMIWRDRIRGGGYKDYLLSSLSPDIAFWLSSPLGVSTTLWRALAFSLFIYFVWDSQAERVTETTYRHITQILHQAAHLRLRPLAKSLVVAVVTWLEWDPQVEPPPIYVVRIASIPVDCWGHVAAGICHLT